MRHPGCVLREPLLKIHVPSKNHNVDPEAGVVLYSVLLTPSEYGIDPIA